jgi:hypothetical protein
MYLYAAQFLKAKRPLEFPSLKRAGELLEFAIEIYENEWKKKMYLDNDSL